ncbi:hypothetical protein OG21DRAFT_1022726 [Imleria badia]|nr:hypothetical protein OG21DRAFT_1022726 [Imleria badia]
MRWWARRTNLSANCFFFASTSSAFCLSPCSYEVNVGGWADVAYLLCWKCSRNEPSLEKTLTFGSEGVWEVVEVSDVEETWRRRWWWKVAGHVSSRFGPHRRGVVLCLAHPACGRE